MTEAIEPAPTDAYGCSKLAAERGLAEVDINWVALRATLVYGLGVKGNMAQLMQVARSPLPLPVGGLRARRSLLAVENSAAAIETVLAAPGTLRRAFIAADPRALTVAEMIDAMRLWDLGAGRTFFPFRQRCSGSCFAPPAAMKSTGGCPVRSSPIPRPCSGSGGCRHWRRPDGLARLMQAGEARCCRRSRQCPAAIDRRRALLCSTAALRFASLHQPSEAVGRRQCLHLPEPEQGRGIGDERTGQPPVDFIAAGGAKQEPEQRCRKGKNVRPAPKSAAHGVNHFRDGASARGSAAMKARRSVPGAARTVSIAAAEILHGAGSERRERLQVADGERQGRNGGRSISCAMLPLTPSP